MKTVTTVLGQEVTITPEMRFVTFSDKVMSGWGGAENRTSKRIIICNNWHEAERLADALQNAPQSDGIRHVNTCSKFPYYSPSKVCISIDLYEDWARGWVMRYTNIPERR